MGLSCKGGAFFAPRGAASGWTNSGSAIAGFGFARGLIDAENTRAGPVAIHATGPMHGKTPGLDERFVM
jgi:hypothetical protein